KGLDDSRRGEVENLFVSLDGTTLLCVTHDLEFAKHTAHRISVMYAGQILETADKEEFFQEPLHPYSRMLIQSLPENGFQFSAGFAPSHDDCLSVGCRFAGRCPLAGERCSNRPPLVNYKGRQVQCWNYVENAKTM
ncbi:MAG: oligopeptide/dipeptide ABC transporter ATP-binding protein, partial [Muricoprocola sp.]